MKTAEQMRKITLKHKYNNERIDNLIFELNSLIKQAAKDGIYSIRRFTRIWDKEEAEYIKLYYENLKYKVEFHCAWREIYISWE